MRQLALVLAAAIIFVSTASAQTITERLIRDLPDLPSPQTYGTADEVTLQVNSAAFDVHTAATMNWAADNYYRWVTTGAGCCLDAPFHLPAGALITGLSIEGCDNAAGGRIVGLIGRCEAPHVGCSVVGLAVATGISEMPGCVSRRVDLDHTVDNSANSYFIEFANEGVVNGSVNIVAARVHYKLQVSPAPLTPTFTDVPATHPFYQFIEALAAAGITGGCAGPPLQYCPEAPITRGQMAVFLSRALGLHWAP